MAIKLHLVRHGQASFGSSNYDVLSPVGHAQAKHLGKHFAAIGHQIDGVVVGRMQRQIDTAAGLIDAPAAITLPQFDEFDAEALFQAYLPLAMRDNPTLPRNPRDIFSDRKIFQRAFEAVLAHWIPATEPVKPMLETWTQFCARVVDGLRQITEQFADGSRVVAVTSGGPISVCIRHALGLTDASTFHLNWRTYNASINELRLRRLDDGVQAALLGFNDVSYLRMADAGNSDSASLLTHR